MPRGDRGGTPTGHRNRGTGSKRGGARPVRNAATDNRTKVAKAGWDAFFKNQKARKASYERRKAAGTLGYQKKKAAR